MMLREYARQEKQKQLNCRMEKKRARAGGQMALAMELAKQENEHQILRDLYDATASQLIFSSTFFFFSWNGSTLIGFCFVRK